MLFVYREIPIDENNPRKILLGQNIFVCRYLPTNKNFSLRPLCLRGEPRFVTVIVKICTKVAPMTPTASQSFPVPLCPEKNSGHSQFSLGEKFARLAAPIRRIPDSFGKAIRG